MDLIVMNDTISPHSRTIITMSLFAPPLLDPQRMAPANHMAVPEANPQQGCKRWRWTISCICHSTPQDKSFRSFYFPLLHNHRVQLQSSPSISVCSLAESLTCTSPLESVSLSRFLVFNCIACYHSLLILATSSACFSVKNRYYRGILTCAKTKEAKRRVS